MSTTGYGDLVPSSKLGKVVAAVCAIYGLVMLSFPIALLGTRFTEEWKTFKFEQLEEADRKGLETGGVKRRLEHTPKEIAEKLRAHIAHIDKVLVEAQVLHRSMVHRGVSDATSADTGGGDEALEGRLDRPLVQEQGGLGLAEPEREVASIIKDRVVQCCGQ